MQRILIGDAVAAARALLALPDRLHAFALRRMLAEAAAAHAFRRKQSRMHPLWGDGSLMAAALRRTVEREPYLDDPRYRQCLVRVLRALDHLD